MRYVLEDLLIVTLNYPVPKWERERPSSLPSPVPCFSRCSNVYAIYTITFRTHIPHSLSFRRNTLFVPPSEIFEGAYRWKGATSEREGEREKKETVGRLCRTLSAVLPHTGTYETKQWQNGAYHNIYTPKKKLIVSWASPQTYACVRRPFEKNFFVPTEWMLVLLLFVFCGLPRQFSHTRRYVYRYLGCLSSSHI